MNPTHIIFCAAVPLEVKSLCQVLSMPLPTAQHPISHGRFKTINITVLVSGVGIHRMMHRLQQAQPMTYSCWVSYGFAGALSSHCEPGGVYCGNAVQYQHHEEVCGEPLQGFEFPEQNTLLCSGELISTPQKKMDLHYQTKANLVDMESFAVAVMANYRQEPFFWIRGISDAYDEPLPAELLHCLDQNGFPSVLKSTLQILKNPILLPKALKLGNITQKLQKNISIKSLQIIKKLIDM